MAHMYETVEGIKPVRPAISLWNSAFQLPASIPFDSWRSGIQWRSELISRTHPWPLNCDVVTDEKVVAEPREIPQFGPFSLYLDLDQCRYIIDDAREMRDLAEMFDAGFTWQFAYQFWTGAVDPSIPSLQSTATALTIEAPGASVDALKAVDWLLSGSAHCSNTGGQLLHFPSILAGHFLNNIYMNQVGNTYYGPMGSLMVPDFGYPYGEGADGSATAWGPLLDPDDPSAGFLGQANDEVWIYVTNRVERDIGTPVELPRTEIERRGETWLNSWSGSWEAPVIYRFDPGCVYAVLVKIPNSLAAGS